MPFDSATRNRLQAFVTAARILLQSEFAEMLPTVYGIRDDGSSDAIEILAGLDEPGLELASTLRERMAYLAANHGIGKTDAANKWAVDQLKREQAFTVLNRLAAIRMAEKRGIVQESMARGYQSNAFKVYEILAGNALGETFHRYRQFLDCLFDELAVDLGALFDRHSPQGLLFPRESAFLKLLELFNDRDLENLWAEDETIGWIYQYYNDPDERKEMRDKSAAPRNSRELAVRNQFFTPRYVVEFLTDNTLGRIWYEMCQGQTNLKDRCRYLVRRPNEIFLKEGEATPELHHQDNLSQEELLKQPVYIPHRQLKDPRTILMLDPACGSMHFGLYAFDLFEEIYHEAWVREEQNPGALLRPTGMMLLHQSYPNKTLFLADIPRLIIEHNIHGVDIDPRATQIAALSLWLRAHRTWNDQKTPLAQRPRITKSHIVCAEPMPGDPGLLQEFVKVSFPENEHSLFQRLLEQIFVKMQLAGEAGSLLKIEEEITSAVEEAKVAWAKNRSASKELFGTAELNAAKKPGSQADLLGLDTALIALDVPTDFWEGIEERIYAALRDYAEQAETGAGFQQRLFAEDAVRGFAFIDVCRKSYDVVVMNPPFGEATSACQKVLAGYPKGTSANLYALFLVQAARLTTDIGAFGAISDSTFLKQPTFIATRRMLLSKDSPLYALVDLGWGVLDANVRTAVSVVMKSNSEYFYALDIVDEESRDVLLFEAVANSRLSIKKHSEILALPKSVFALNLSVKAGRELVGMNSLSSLCSLPWGCGANDAFQLFRLRWEIGAQHVGTWWAFLTNGGSFSPFYRENYLVCRREMENGESAFTMEFRAGTDKLYDAAGQELYFLPGLTYPKRSEFFHVSVLAKGHVFTPEGKGLFLNNTSAVWLQLAVLNSSFVASVGGIVCGPHKQRGDVELIKIPLIQGQAVDSLAHEAKATFELGRRLMQSEETSAWFLFPGAPRQALDLLVSLNDLMKDRELIISDAAEAARAGLRLIDSQVEAAVPTELREFCKNPELEIQRSKLWNDLTLSSADFVTFFFGVAFGRWDIRYATGEQAAPELPDPFAPLPVCPPGQLQNAHGLPAGPEDMPADYPVDFPWNGILVDDENHPCDIVDRVCKVIEIIWKDRAEAIEQEACEILGVQSLRDYFRRPAGFFADHLRRYSKSRRQAPIYWPLSTSKGNYTLWIYYHRLTDQTLHTALVDFVEPKLENVNIEIGNLRQEGIPTGRLEELMDLQSELKDFQSELNRIIKLPWKPNLNDGVLITASPLWKLFRLPRWQKDLKSTWEELEKGDYDWAHLAYSIWPARVEQVCKTDRSIAIAHGLEHLCTVESPKPKRSRKAAADEGDAGELFPGTDGDDPPSTRAEPKKRSRSAQAENPTEASATPKRRGRPPKNKPAEE